MSLRRSGLLLHISSLPSLYGIGDLGPGAYEFADFLAEGNQGLWQTLPLNPTSLECGNSPYSSCSAFAGNPLLISPDLLLRDGCVSEEDLGRIRISEEGGVNYHAATDLKKELFSKLFENTRHLRSHDQRFQKFCLKHKHWLDDFALYTVLKQEFGGLPWYEWPHDLKYRNQNSVVHWSERLREKIEEQKYIQFVFFRQWAMLKEYCNERGIRILGDLPIYVDYDSADVWANTSLFHLDEQKRPIEVAGVPPDYFSTTGQLWGNPVYRWDVLKERGYEWWIRRLGHNLELFDIVRLDHFRGFVAFWAVPREETTAVNGNWREGPAADFFKAVFRYFHYVPIIAEDLGVITADVREMIREFKFPGMRVLQFAFGWDVSVNPHAPHNHTKNTVIYPGTHDNNTARGWFEQELSEEDKMRICDYLGRSVDASTIHWDLIRLSLMSVADTVIIPVQDLLGLGDDARMNIPAVAGGNWRWRLHFGELKKDLAKELSRLTRLFGRA